jgi:hypothetical protein
MISENSPTITDLHKRVLRAFLVGPKEERETCLSELMEERNDSPGYPTLLAFALGTMVRRRFPRPYSWGDVIRYVADLRIRLHEQAREVNPRMTEDLIRFLLSDPSLEEPPINSENQEELASIQQLLLFSLITEAGLDDVQVNDLINEAADAAMATA